MNKALIPSLILLSFLYFTSCEDAIEEDSYGNISGIVVDIVNQEPLSGAIVTTNPPSQSVMTDKEGKFSLSEMEIGDYVLSGTKYEFKSNSVNIRVKSEKTTNVILQLEEKDATNSSVTIANPIPAHNSPNTATSIRLAWQPIGTKSNTNAAYKLQIYSSESATPIIDTDNLSDTTQQVDNLEHNKTYLWQVSAYKNDVQVGQSPLWSFRTSDIPAISFLYTRKTESSYHIWGSVSKEDQGMQLTQSTQQNLYPRINPITGEILYSALHNTQVYLYLMDKDGSNNRLISPLPVTGHHNPGYGFCWAPNGEEILFCHYNKLYKIKKDGSGLFNLSTAPPERNYVFCNWSAQTNKIVVQTRGVNIYDSEIALIDNDGKNEQVMIPNEDGCTEYPSFSPDGKKILYTQDASGINAINGRQFDSRIIVYNLETQEKTDLSALHKPNGTNDSQPSFSPDGSKIIFVNSSNTGLESPNIWAMNLSGNERELYFNNAEYPQWH